MSQTIKDDSSDTTSTTQDEILSRRAVLRAALMVGCSLIVPITLFSAPASGANSAAPVADKKLAQAGVKYQHQPKGEQKCSGCLNYIATSKTCQRVAGSIDPNGWCILWAKKA